MEQLEVEQGTVVEPGAEEAEADAEPDVRPDAQTQPDAEQEREADASSDGESHGEDVRTYMKQVGLEAWYGYFEKHLPANMKSVRALRSTKSADLQRMATKTNMRLDAKTLQQVLHALKKEPRREADEEQGAELNEGANDEATPQRLSELRSNQSSGHMGSVGDDGSDHAGYGTSSTESSDSDSEDVDEVLRRLIRKKQSSEAVSSEPSASESWLPTMPELPDMPSFYLPDMYSWLDAFPRELPASIADLTGAAASAASAQDGVTPEPDSEEGRLPPGATEAEQKADALGRADQQMPVGTPIIVAGHGRGKCVGFERSWFGPNMHFIRFSSDADTEVAEGVPPETQPPTVVDEAAPAERTTAVLLSQEQPDAADQAQNAVGGEAAVRSHLEGLRLTELRKQAEQASVSEEDVDTAIDSGDPKGALIDLLVKYRHAPVAFEESDRDHEAIASLRRELALLELSELRRRAISMEVDKELLEAADDADNSKQSIIELVVRHQTSLVAAPSAEDASPAAIILAKESRVAAEDEDAAAKAAEQKMVDEAPSSGGVPVALNEVRWTVFACEFEGFEETVRQQQAAARAKLHTLAENPSRTVEETAGGTTSSPAADAVAQMTPEQKAVAAQSLSQQQGRADQAMAIGTPIYVAGKGRGIYSGFVRNWVGANHHTIKFRAGVDESEVLAEVTETLTLRDCCWTAIEAKMAVGGRLAKLADMTRVPQTMIALEDCIVRAAADKNSEALWTLPAGEVIEVLRTVTVPATSSGGGGSTKEGSEPLSTLQELESGNAAGTNNVERVFFSRPDLGLDGWVSTSTSEANGTVRPLLEDFKGASLTMEYEDIPEDGTFSVAMEPEPEPAADDGVTHSVA